MLTALSKTVKIATQADVSCLAAQGPPHRSSQSVSARAMCKVGSLTSFRPRAGLQVRRMWSRTGGVAYLGR